MVICVSLGCMCRRGHSNEELQAVRRAESRQNPATAAGVRGHERSARTDQVERPY